MKPVLWVHLPQKSAPSPLLLEWKKIIKPAHYTNNRLHANFLSLPNQSYTYENLYWSFMLFLTIFFRPLRPFLILQVGVSLREVLSVVEVLPTLDVSSCKKQIYFRISCMRITFWTRQSLCGLPHWTRPHPLNQTSKVFLAIIFHVSSREPLQYGQSILVAYGLG